MGHGKAAFTLPASPRHPGGAVKYSLRLSQDRLEGPRLRLRPVVGGRYISQAFELIQLAGIKAGLQLPSGLSSQTFRSKLVGDEPFALFLMEEKAGGDPIGLVGAWAVSPSRGWPQILYAVRPERRGCGYAREGAEVLIRNLFKDKSVMGVGAVVVGPNLDSMAVLGKLGMDLIHQWDDRQFFGLSRQQFEQSGCSPVKAPGLAAEDRPPSTFRWQLESFLERLLDRYDGRGTKTTLQKLVIRACSALLVIIQGTL